MRVARTVAVILSTGVVGTTSALVYIDGSDELLAAMKEDATGGFAGPGFVDFDGPEIISDFISLDEGFLEVTGTFRLFFTVDATLPSSTALLVYLELDDESFLRGEGTFDSSTGVFTASVTDVPDGSSKIFYSFVVLDPEDALKLDRSNSPSVFSADVISFSCPSPLTITLEWSTDNSDLDMEVTEPSGSSWYAGDIGEFGFGSGDITEGFGPEIWAVLPGNSGAVGTYTVRVYFVGAPGDTEWTLTARVNNEVAWVETGTYEAPESEFSSFLSGTPESDLFYVTLDSVDAEDC